jgi:hypothetical protein
MQFDYISTKVNGMKAHASRNGNGKVTVHQMDIDGRPCNPTPRFWTALQANFGFSSNIFSYFTHEEVFNRIAQVVPDDELRVCIERSENDRGEPIDNLLAVSKPSKTTAMHDDLVALLEKHGLDVSNIDYGKGKRHGGPAGFGRGTIGTGGSMLTSTGANSDPTRILGDGIHANDGTVAGATPMEQLSNLPEISYHQGVMRSFHRVRNSDAFCIGGDEFCNRFALDVPIDGYGKPAVHLVLLRIVCSNLAIGYSNVFRSEISLGKGQDKFDYALGRAIEGFNNEDGFAALRQRFELAQRSWCSIAEINKAYKCLVRLHAKGEVVNVQKKFLTDAKDQFSESLVADGSPIIQSFHRMVGDLHRAYGMANLDALSQKRQSTLPGGADVYSMINFLSEVGTHHATAAGGRVLQAHIGDLLSAEYDLEGTRDKYGDWKEFLISDSSASENFQIAQQL